VNAAALVFVIARIKTSGTDGALEDVQNIIKNNLLIDNPDSYTSVPL
jgi:hypothetical protein